MITAFAIKGAAMSPGNTCPTGILGFADGTQVWVVDTFFGAAITIKGAFYAFGHTTPRGPLQFANRTQFGIVNAVF